MTNNPLRFDKLYLSIPKPSGIYRCINIAAMSCGHVTLSKRLHNVWTFGQSWMDVNVSINRIYHRSPMQTEKSQPSGERIMSETKYPSFRHYPLTRGLGFLDLHRRPMIDYFSYLSWNKIVSFPYYFFYNLC